MSRYRKTIAAALGAAGIALVAALTDGTVSPAETVGIAVAVLTALGVYVAPNTPPPDQARYRYVGERPPRPAP